MSKRLGKDIPVFLILFLILGIALFLRLFGINHGYPFVFHPDEATIIRSALGIRFDINPGHFDWPHLYIYLNYFLYMVFAKVRNILPPNMFPLLWNDSWIFYPLTRILTAVLGALTIFPIYLSARTLFNKKIGIYSAMAFSILPFHVWQSHYALTDVPMVFFLSWGLYFASKILRTKNASIKNYVFAGVFIGLSASTKYNGGLSAVMIPLATLFNTLNLYSLDGSSSRDNNKSFTKILRLFLSFKNIWYWCVSGFFAIFGFLLGTPFALLDFDTFSRTDGPKGALWQFTNVGSVNFIPHIIQFVNDIVFKISDDLGYTFLLGFLIVLFLSVYKFYVYLKTKKHIETNFSLYFISIMAIYLLWYISGFEKSRSHFYNLGLWLLGVLDT